MRGDGLFVRGGESQKRMPYHGRDPDGEARCLAAPPGKRNGARQGISIAWKSVMKARSKTPNSGSSASPKSTTPITESARCRHARTRTSASGYTRTVSAKVAMTATEQWSSEASQQPITGSNPGVGGAWSRTARRSRTQALRVRAPRSGDGALNHDTPGQPGARCRVNALARAGAPAVPDSGVSPSLSHARLRRFVAVTRDSAPPSHSVALQRVQTLFPAATAPAEPRHALTSSWPRRGGSRVRGAAGAQMLVTMNMMMKALVMGTIDAVSAAITCAPPGIIHCTKN